MTARTRIRFIAIALSLAYGVFRFWVVSATLTTYGVNPWIFLGVDLIAGTLYVLGIEQLIIAATTTSGMLWRRTISWAIIAVVSFAAPYFYLFIHGQQLPSAFTIGLVVVAALLLLNAVLSVRRSIQRSRHR